MEKFSISPGGAGRHDGASAPSGGRPGQDVELLAQAIEHLPVAVSISDRSGVIEYINARFCRETGYRAEELIGQPMRILQSGQTPVAVYQALWTGLLAGTEWRGELLNRRRDGGLHWQAVSISPLFDADQAIVHFVAVHADIAGRNVVPVNEVQKQAAPRALDAASPLRDRRILVVDDQDLNQVIMEDLLGMAGIHVDLAGHGQAALDRLAEHPPGYYDLVLMDIQMPVMDGVTAMQAIRASGRHAALPVVALTANTSPEDRQRYADAGFADHLGKPFQPEALMAMLSRLIGAGHSRSASAAPPSILDAASALAAATALTPEQDPEVPLAGCDLTAGLGRFGNNLARYRSWLARFCHEAPGMVAEISHNLGGPHHAEAMKKLHAFKGQVGTLGFTALHASTTQFEAELKAAGTWPAAEDGQASLRIWQDAFDDLHQRLEARLAEPDWPALKG